MAVLKANAAVSRRLRENVVFFLMIVVFNELNSWIGLYARLSFFVMFSIISRGVSAGLPTATAPNLAIKIKKESVPACFFLFSWQDGNAGAALIIVGTHI